MGILLDNSLDKSPRNEVMHVITTGGLSREWS